MDPVVTTNIQFQTTTMEIRAADTRDPLNKWELAEKGMSFKDASDEISKGKGKGSGPPHWVIPVLLARTPEGEQIRDKWKIEKKVSTLVLQGTEYEYS